MLNAEKHKQLNTLIQMVYKTATDPSEWEKLLVMLSDQFSAHLATNLDQNAHTGKARLLSSIGYSEKAHQAYAEYYGPRSVLFNDLKSHQQGDVFVDQMIGDYDAYLKSETYHDFFHTDHDGAHGMCLVTHNSNGLLNYIVLRRSQLLGQFDQDEFEMAGILLPHIIQANQIANKIEYKDVLSESFASAFNQLSVGVVIVNSSHEVAFSNITAEYIFNRNDGLTISQKKLTTNKANDNTVLKKVIENAFAQTLSDKTYITKTCLVNRSIAARPYQLSVMPLIQGKITKQHRHEFALITITDPDNSALNNAELIAELYQLTPTEARIAQAYCNGMNTQEITYFYHITENAVRFHTKNIFQKLNVNRQSELVSLILNGPVSLLFK